MHKQPRDSVALFSPLSTMSEGREMDQKRVRSLFRRGAGMAEKPSTGFVGSKMGDLALMIARSVKRSKDKIDTSERWDKSRGIFVKSDENPSLDEGGHDMFREDPYDSYQYPAVDDPLLDSDDDDDSKKFDASTQHESGWGKRKFANIARKHLIVGTSDRHRRKTVKKMMNTTTNKIDSLDMSEDLTVENLTAVFNMYDTEGTGSIDKCAFLDCCQLFMGGQMDEQEDFALLWQVMESRSDFNGRVGLSLFIDTIKRIKMLILYQTYNERGSSALLDKVTDASNTRSKEDLEVFQHDLEDNSAEEADRPITVIEYSLNFFTASGRMSILEYLEKPMGPRVRVRWVNVDGLEPLVVRALGIQHNLHPLVIEEIVSVSHKRPRYDSNKGVIMIPMFTREEDNSLSIEQVSMLLLKHDIDEANLVKIPSGRVADSSEWGADDEDENIREKPLSVGNRQSSTILLFQEPCKPGDAFDDIRLRIAMAASRVRHSDGQFLLYSLVDEAVDAAFPVVDAYGEYLEQLEYQMHEQRFADADIKDVYRLRKNLYQLRRNLRPLRDVIGRITKDTDDYLTPYWEDCQNHVVDLLETIESYVELTKSLMGDWNSVTQEQQNQVLYLLTLVSMIFIPAQFLTGVYGMNFEYMPELSWKYSYLLFWIACIILTTGVILWFRRANWL